MAHAFTDLVAEGLAAGRLRPGDPRSYGQMLCLAITTYHHTAYLRADRVVSQDDFLRFCLAGVGADAPDGWLDRFRLSDDQAAVSRARTYEISATIRRVPHEAGNAAVEERESR